MQALKMSLWLGAGSVVVFIAYYVLKLEVFTIPAMLYAKHGQLGVTTHVLGILFLIVGSGTLGSLLAKATIFGVHEKLIASHLNSVLDAIGNLTTGRWSSDSYTHREAFKTGAVLGYKVGQAESGLPDRNLIVDGIGKMALPESRPALGQDSSVVDEMSSYFDDLSARKQRLSS